MQGIGHTLLVLAPALAPIPLTRAWCLFEIYATVATETPLTVQMPPAEATAFERALVEDFDSIQTKLSAVDLRTAEAWSAADRANIFAVVEAGPGFSALNQVVMEQMRRWLAEAGRAALARLPPSERGTSALINRLATLLQYQGDREGAEPLFREALKARREVLGDRHPSTLTSIGYLADLLREMGRLAEAQAVLGDAVAVARETLGERNLLALATTAKAARLQHAQPGGAAAGKELLAATVAQMAEVLGPSHAKTNKYRQALQEMEPAM